VRGVSPRTEKPIKHRAFFHSVKPIKFEEEKDLPLGSEPVR
jgi:hypothetical protein